MIKRYGENLNQFYNSNTVILINDLIGQPFSDKS